MKFLKLGVLFFLAIVFNNSNAAAQTVSSTPSERPISDYRIVPVRVHILQSANTPAANATLTAADIKRIFGKVNTIWHHAGVHMWVESVVVEKAEHTAGHESDKDLATNSLLQLRPEGSHPGGMFNVYYIGAMLPNGIYMRNDAVFVKQSAQLRPVVGGIDEPLPRVTAHELGHGMSLPHRQDTFNLMASGTTGTSLNDLEIDAVRNTVLAFSWALTPEAFLKLADEDIKMSKKDTAISRYRSLSELPGKSAVKDAALKNLAKISGN